jgi:class 3 adenylate cyclase/tetratricopeptide (TPR) repeat protein
VAVCASCGHDNREGAKFCEECGFPLAGRPPQAREQRKTVTVLFCDLTGSTALGERLDPERLRALLSRYFERMKGIAERYGGSVEKFIGDAVMAVFGVPVVHEDDALRALRSAIEMRDALPELGLQGRIGVMTGEVVTGTEDWLAGDAVNVAARLEQAALPGEVLLGGPTLALVGDAAEVEPVEALDLKGKSEPVAAYRLVRVLDTPERPHEALFVGREPELSIVREAWERARAEPRCELVTLLGDAGIGKSRLAAEVLASIEATVVRGRCLSYGEGITYWPVVEVLRQLDQLPSDEAAAAAIRSLLGETAAATSADEIAWAFRKTLEHAAKERPLVVVVDDLHRGEETFLDLIEHVALLSSGAPILLLCLARPELLDRRSDWPITLRLEPLGEDDVATLIPGRVPGELRERIARAAGGNPLFIEEMLAIAGEADGDVVVPPTLQTLLAARLDQLEAAERTVLERGAIEGEIFHRGAVQALAPDRTQVTPRLAALVRKELIRPTKPQLAGEDGFRFRHLLIRDAAYEALPKAARADLHQRFAAWLEEHGADLAELDEILGYHLEQAWLYRAELGAPEDGSLRAAARRRLAAAGGRALARSDNFAAVNLLERAAALMPQAEIDVALEHSLVFALLWAGKTGEALERATSIAERSSLAGDRVGELCGRILEGRLHYYLEPQGATERLDVLVQRALPVFQAARNDLALYLGYSALGAVAAMRAQMDARRDADEKAFVHAQRAGLIHPELGRFGARLFGTTPVRELLAWLAEQEAGGMPAHDLRQYRALPLAMLGRFDEARALLADVRADLADRGGGLALATSIGQDEVLVELLAGDFATAAALGTEACKLLDDLGEKSILSTAAGRLAQALYALDRLDEADDWAERASGLGASDDAMTQMLWRQVRAKVLARRRDDDAEPLAREAVAIGEGTDMLNFQGDAYADLGEVLLLAGKPDEAVAALERAAERYERKGNLVSTRRAQTRVAEVRAEAAATQA